VHYTTVVLDLEVKRIPDPVDTAAWLRLLLQQNGINVLESLLHEYPSPVPDEGAYTLVFILSSSHAIIHTAPEVHWVEVTLAFCDGRDPTLIIPDIEKFYAPSKVRIQMLSGRPPGEA